MKKYKLPNKPSELILLGLKDLEKCKKDKRYFINMGLWHSHMIDNTCSVCQGGVVMAQSLGCDYLKNNDINQFGLQIYNKLKFLNLIRSGSIVSGLDMLKIKDSHLICRKLRIKYRDEIMWLQGVYVINLTKDYRKYVKCMQALAQGLKDLRL